MNNNSHYLKKLIYGLFSLFILALPTIANATRANNAPPVEQTNFLPADEIQGVANTAPSPDVIRHPALETPPRPQPEKTPAEAAPQPVPPMVTPGEAAQSLTGASPAPSDISPSPTEPGQSRHYRFH